MRLALTAHPASPATAVREIEVHAERQPGGRLALRYVLRATPHRIRIAAESTSQRAHELWHTTCFEAFVRAAPGDAYYELHFAPSTCWAAYRFDGYRDNMRAAHDITPSEVVRQETREVLEVRAALGLPEADARWQLGLSAVVEQSDGALSYWALAHPPGPPDFHHSTGFALELA